MTTRAKSHALLRPINLLIHLLGSRNPQLTSTCLNTSITGCATPLHPAGQPVPSPSASRAAPVSPCAATATRDCEREKNCIHAGGRPPKSERNVTPAGLMAKVCMHCRANVPINIVKGVVHVAYTAVPVVPYTQRIKGCGK
jgi:hypothetical protein